MKLFFLLSLESVKARRTKVKDECDRAHLPDIPHAEWFCKYDGIASDSQHPEEVWTRAKTSPVLEGWKMELLPLSQSWQWSID